MTVNWMYFRKNWNSCRKAQEFLDAQDIEVESRTDAGKEKFDSTAAWERIESAESIRVAKGKRVDVFDPTDGSQDDILAAVMGRSGNLRAPTLQVGDTFFVGFNQQLYEAILTS